MPTLDWIGKQAVLHHHRSIPVHLLDTDACISVGKPGAHNLLVQGDNLLALKALLPHYGGRVRGIFIDPPYNTGNEAWIYNDAVNSPEMRDWLGKVVGKDAEDLSRHDKWLCMMYPRLQLLAQFLREDGVILVSIDDNEVSHLQLLLDEVFGPQNHIATLVWEKGKKGDSTFFSVTHEYILVYGKSKATLKRKKDKWRRRKAGIDEALTKYRELREEVGDDHDAIRQEMMAWYKSVPAKHPAKKLKHYNWSDRRGLYFAADFSGPDDGRENRPRWDIPHPVTGKPCKKPRTGWRWEEDKRDWAMAQDPPRIHFGADHTTIPCRKSYLEEVDTEPFPSVFYKDGRAATLEVDRLVKKRAFDFPKDSDVLADLLGLFTGPSDTILDSFAGSGSTGHAVMKLNERDGGQRRFILVEMEDRIARDVTVCRLKGAIEEIESGHTKPVARPLGFEYCRLGQTLFDEQGNIRKSVRFDELARYVFFAETGTPLEATEGKKGPFLGAHRGVGVYLLYNGILGDRTEAGGNVLTSALLQDLPPHDGPRVIYGEGCLITDQRLREGGITFKQTPYEIKVG